jgi:hypothetical protein
VLLYSKNTVRCSLVRASASSALTLRSVYQQQLFKTAAKDEQRADAYLLPQLAMPALAGA